MNNDNGFIGYIIGFIAGWCFMLLVMVAVGVFDREELYNIGKEACEAGLPRDQECSMYFKVTEETQG